MEKSFNNVDPLTEIFGEEEKSAVDKGLPDPDLVSKYRLARDRVIYLEGEIDDKSLSVQRMIVGWNLDDRGVPKEDRRPITILIFSEGGDADVMWSIVDCIEASETPVCTVNLGMAASAAGIIYLAGHKRLMTRRSRMLIHEGSAWMHGDALKVMDASENYKIMIQLMKDYILSRTKITASTLNKQKGHDWVLNAKYCLEHGACEGIVERIEDVM